MTSVKTTVEPAAAAPLPPNAAAALDAALAQLWRLPMQAWNGWMSNGCFPDLEPGFAEIAARCLPYTMTSLERMYALYKAVQYAVAKDVPGAVVECGVWKGGSAMLAALALLRHGDPSRHIYLYDTFTGMSAPSEKDTGAIEFGWNPLLPAGAPQLPDFRQFWAGSQQPDYNSWCFGSLDEVRANLRSTGYGESELHYVPGKVEDTLPGTLPERIAVLRLDTDWYESTYHELKHLFPRLSPGGVLIVDDYGSFQGARRATDQYLRESGARILLTRIDYTGRLGVKVGR